MSKLLDIKDGSLTISPEAIGISFLGDIWISDTSKDKSKALLDIKYIYYYSDFNSPYFIYPENERIKYIKEFVTGNSYKPSKTVLEAIRLYKELNMTPGMKQLEAAYIALSKSEQYLRSVDYNKMDDNGRFLYDPEKVQKMIVNMPKLIEALNQAKDICMKEQSSTTRVRGNKSISQFED